MTTRSSGRARCTQGWEKGNFENVDDLLRVSGRYVEESHPTSRDLSGTPFSSPLSFTGAKDAGLSFWGGLSLPGLGKVSECWKSMEKPRRAQKCRV